MTVSSTINKSGPYSGNGVTVDFEYEFRILDEAHITVVKAVGGVETVLTLAADYTVSGVGALVGGSITLDTPPATGETITLVRNASFDQQVDLENQGAYYAETVERALDLAAMRDQQLAEGLARAVQIPISASPADLDHLVGDIIRLGVSADEIDTVAGISGAVSTVAGISADVSEVSAVAAGVAVVAGISDEVVAVAGNAENINAVAGIEAEIIAVPAQVAAAEDARDAAEAARDAARDTIASYVTVAGAKGDGVANDTPAFEGLAAKGGHITVPPGTYLIDPILFTKPVYIELQAGAVVKLRSISATDCAPFMFGAGAEGSSITGGGTIDGNRLALLADYLALPRTPQYGGASYVIDTEINGILAAPCEGLRVSGIAIQNCLTHAFVHRSGDNPRYEDLTIIDCGKLANAQFFNGGAIRRIVGKGIGNLVNGTALPFWQPGGEFRDTVGTIYEDIEIVDFAPAVRDGVGDVIGDPFPIAFAFERITGGTIRNLSANGYTFDPADTKTTSLGFGFLFSALTGVELDGVVANGYYWGAEFQSLQGSTVNGILIDGDYNVVSVNSISAGAEPAGIRIRSGGINPFVTSLPDNDTRASAGSHGNVWGAGLVTRSGVGLNILSGEQQFNGIRSVGNVSYGWHVGTGEASSSFPNTPLNSPSRVVLNGCSGIFNGLGGLGWTGGSNIQINGGAYDNNGQETLNAFIAAGITTIGTVQKQGMNVTGASASDTQSFTRADSVSFVPGAVDSRMRKVVYMTNADGLSVGQRIKIANALASGDATGKIVHINKDAVTIEPASAVTFVDTGNLTALAGTASSSGIVVTGAGTAFLTAFTGPTVIKAAGQYRRVTKVISNTSVNIDEPFSPQLSAGTAVQALQCDLVGIPSQRHGLYVDPAYVTGVKYDVLARGNIVANIAVSSSSMADDWTDFNPQYSTPDGTGVAVAGGGKYKIDGKVLHIKGYVQLQYTLIPTAVLFVLPTGATAGGAITDGAVFVVGSNGTTRNYIMGFCNANTIFTLTPITGALASASGQFISWSGSVKMT